MKSKFVYLIGPTSVGKGFIVKLMMRVCTLLVRVGFLRVEVLSFGQIIRDLLEKDETFRTKYEESIAKGKLLPDREAIRIFQKQIDFIKASGREPDFIIVDGFCRSADQIAYAYEHGYLRPHDQVFIIEAPIGVCMDRFLHRNSGSSERNDKEIETFHFRYHLHTNTVGGLRHMFGECGIPVIDINAEKNIAEHVGPSVISHFMEHAVRMTDFQKRKPFCQGRRHKVPA